MRSASREVRRSIFRPGTFSGCDIELPLRSCRGSWWINDFHCHFLWRQTGALPGRDTLPIATSTHVPVLFTQTYPTTCARKPVYALPVQTRHCLWFMRAGESGWFLQCDMNVNMKDLQATAFCQSKGQQISFIKASTFTFAQCGCALHFCEVLDQP